MKNEQLLFKWCVQHKYLSLTSGQVQYDMQKMSYLKIFYFVVSLLIIQPLYTEMCAMKISNTDSSTVAFMGIIILIQSKMQYFKQMSAFFKCFTYILHICKTEHGNEIK